MSYVVQFCVERAPVALFSPPPPCAPSVFQSLVAYDQRRSPSPVSRAPPSRYLGQAEHRYESLSALSVDASSFKEIPNVYKND